MLGMKAIRADVAEDLATAAHRRPTAAYVWGLLHWYARESVRDGTVIVFC